MTPRRLIEPARLAGTALLHTQSDERLVDLTRAGNDRAFEAIVSRYRRELLRHCASILPPERAEDAVQQAFLNAYKAIASGEAELKLRPWLYRVAHNASINLLRQNGWNHEQIPEDFDGVVQPPQALEQREHIRQVVRNVKDLPERQRDAIVLRELEGRSYEEIAAALGVTDGAVRQLLNRARNTLRAAATSITPPQLLERLVDRLGGDAPAAARIAELSLGAGGVATLAKVGAAVVVAGAVAGGVAAGPLHHAARGQDDVAQAAEAAHAGGGAGNDLRLDLGDPFGLHRGPGGSALAQALDLVRDGRRVDSAAFFGGGLTQSGPGPSGGGPGDLVSGNSGPGGGSSGDGGGNSGPGGGGDSGHSGHGSGEDHSGSGSSGSGSGISGGGDSSSGSGSSGSGSSDSGSGSSGSGAGSGDSGSGSSGSGSSGSGSSGSGSGSSGSGSSGSGSGDSGSSIDGSSGSGTSGPG